MNQSLSKFFLLLSYTRFRTPKTDLNHLSLFFFLFSTRSWPISSRFEPKLDRNLDQHPASRVSWSIGPHADQNKYGAYLWWLACPKRSGSALGREREEEDWAAVARTWRISDGSLMNRWSRTTILRQLIQYPWWTVMRWIIPWLWCQIGK
jgi:hypothetical protein